MLEYLLLGGGFAFAAAIQPGPLQAFLLASVTRLGWQRTLPAALAPVVSDGPIILGVIFLLRWLPEGWTGWLRAAGGVFLLYLALISFRQWQRPPEDDREDQKPPRTLLQAVVVNLLNPAPYLGWSLVLGPALIEAWAQSPAFGVALLAAFYGILTLGNALVILLFGTTRFLNPKTRHNLILLSAIFLAGLGVFQIGKSMAGV
ncbi:MAG: LysE family transporter [Anaerolineales bacterium]|nr:LysE family transporter [Anaerolineales bacterium]